MESPRPMLRVLLAGVCAVAAFASQSSRAKACSPPYEPPLPECDVVRIWTPGKIFPVNLHTDLAVFREHFDGNYIEAEEDFVLTEDLSIVREVEGGTEPVAFALAEGGVGAPPNVRQLVLEDPVPGVYHVASVDHFCAGTQSTFSAGVVVASFEMTAEASFPVSLGELTGGELRHEQVTLHLGIDGDCSEITEEAVVSTLDFSLLLSEEALPWAGALSYAVYVDEELFAGFGSYAVSQAGVLDLDIKQICASENPDLVTAKLADGPHTLQIFARLDNSTDEPIASTTLPFEFRCGEPGDVGELSPGVSSKGCAVAGPDPKEPSGAAVWMVLVAYCAWLRRNRLTSRR
jgi:MYXO-CTERM domain-containing protein